MIPTALHRRFDAHQIAAVAATVVLGGALLAAQPATAATGDELHITAKYDGVPVPNLEVHLVRYDSWSEAWQEQQHWEDSDSGRTDSAGVITVQDNSLPDGEYATIYYASYLPTDVAPYATNQLWDGTDYVYQYTKIATQFTIVSGRASATSLPVTLAHNAGELTLRAIDAITRQPINADGDELSLYSDDGYSYSYGARVIPGLDADPAPGPAPGILAQSHLFPGAYFRSEVRRTNDTLGSSTFLPLQTITAGLTTDAGDVLIASKGAPSVESLIHSPWIDQVSGEAAVGNVLTAQRPTDAPGVTFTYQWFVPAVYDGYVERPIAGATSQTYAPSATDIGQQLSVDVVASAPGYQDRLLQGYDTTYPVKVGNPNQGTVTLAGDAKVGGTVTAAVSTVLADAKSYQWYLNGDPILDSVGKTYKVRDSDVGKALSVSARSTVQGHTDAIISSQSVIVAADRQASESPDTSPSASSTAIIGTTGQPTLSVNPGSVAIEGAASFGKTLRANVATAVAGTVAYQWFRNGIRIGGADASSYRIGAIDLSSSLSVVARSSTQGYFDAVLISAPVPVAKDKPSVRATATKTVSAKKPIRVRVLVKPGVSGIDATRKVRIYYSATRFKTIRAVSGNEVAMSLPKLKHGKHTIKIVYPGSASYASKTISLKVRVR